MTATAREFGRPMILGLDREHFGPQGVDVYNSAVLVTPDGRWCEPGRCEQSYYDKMHLVPFGEYMPFVKSMPWLQNLSPLCTSATPGEQPKGFMLKNICLVPNICYETVLPHVIRNQLVTLRQEGRDPQILVNVTNDGWFWGSNELEMHLACGVFRTVECRRPMVIAANTGISASIDASGHILDEGPRRDTKLFLPTFASTAAKAGTCVTEIGLPASAWQRRCFLPLWASWPSDVAAVSGPGFRQTLVIPRRNLRAT